jgi:sRNA-binding protein
VVSTRKPDAARRKRQRQYERLRHQIDALYDDLHQRYPRTFVRDPEQMHPLKIGISHDLRACVETPWRVLNYALRRYTTQPAYLRALIAQRPRLDLCGQAVGTVADDEREAAKAHLIQREKRRRPKASRRQQMDEKPRPSHPQPRPAESASIPAASQSPAATRHERRLPDTWQRILSYLATAAGPQRPVDIGVALGMNHPSGILRRMRERGLVQQVTRGLYEITSAPPDNQASLDACSD